MTLTIDSRGNWKSSKSVQILTVQLEERVGLGGPNLFAGEIKGKKR